MAEGRLPEPGTAFGPCIPECAHLDCAKTRQMAESECVVCQQPIGYNTGFYDRTFGGTERGIDLVHTTCTED